ncbi:Glycosyl transferase family 8 [Macrophomina phaseolina MS6]|uniref:glycogenin glucosyltransferase n=1 Tax=Macrophomina phaseolina (strain MS6) TaxID=1126212 RepID=K2RXA7_MACPH|nr:Glycosyl transferase family 8 [Macrophomina phaseolina MS6]
MALHGEDAYCTLVMSDSYLPGAAVLAHSLRDGGTKKKLAALVTLDTLSADSISELKELYDYVIPVPRVGNPKPANLYLMNRADLAYTFTKIALWRQLQFRKLVYIDADVVAVRAPDELFDIEAPFAAAPDSGWPDCFNSGVMVVSPNMGDYWALQTLAGSGDSFDGADQGLLNQYYEHKGWHRLSFLYNCTPNAQYQWEPAFKHYKSRINLVHFIGKNKPWLKDSRYGGGAGVYNELVARWWAVYDRHLRVKAEHVDTNKVLQVAPNAIQPAAPSAPHVQPVPETGETRPTTEIPFTEPSEPAEHPEQQFHAPPPPPEPERSFSPPQMEWDATRSAPPVESRPEAANFPTQTYTFSEDNQLFKAPAAYPEPPKNMYYEVPKEKPPPKDVPKPIFPWEQERARPKPTRVFAEDLPAPEPEPEPVATPTTDTSVAAASEGEDQTSRTSPPSATPKTPEDPWQTFGQTSANAWDSVPGIERYVRAVMGAQTKKSKPGSISLEGLSKPSDLLSPTGEGSSGRRESLILTDFPTAVERPSLPVTPAPLRRPTFWGGERDAVGELPAAEGVPSQAEWNPEERLETLRRSSLLELEHLRQAASASNAPQRDLPEHSVPRPHHDAQHHSLPITGGASPQGSGETAQDKGVEKVGQSQQVLTDTKTEVAGSDGEKTKPVFSKPDFGAAPAGEAASTEEKKLKEDVLSPTERS